MWLGLLPWGRLTVQSMKTRSGMAVPQIGFVLHFFPCLLISVSCILPLELALFFKPQKSSYLPYYVAIKELILIWALPKLALFSIFSSVFCLLCSVFCG